MIKTISWKWPGEHAASGTFKKLQAKVALGKVVDNSIAPTECTKARCFDTPNRNFFSTDEALTALLRLGSAISSPASLKNHGSPAKGGPSHKPPPLKYATGQSRHRQTDIQTDRQTTGIDALCPLPPWVTRNNTQQYSTHNAVHDERVVPSSVRLLRRYWCRHHDTLLRRCTHHNALVTNLYDFTSTRRPFDCLSKVIKVTVT